MLDLKPAALAKTLILFNMMYQVDTDMDERGVHPTDYFLVMAYTFACQIIPPFEEPRPFIHLPDRDNSAIVRVLRQWQKPWHAISKPAQVRKIVKRKTPPKPPGQGLLPFDKMEQQPDSVEKKDYKTFTALFPSDAAVKQWEPSLAETLAEYRETGQSDKLSQQINRTWAVNNAVLDYDFADFGWKMGEADSSYVEVDALETVDAMDLLATKKSSPQKLKKSQGPSPIERLADVFRLHAISAMKLNSQKRLTVEMIAGETADVMEDYIGGHLTTLLMARPLLKENSPPSIRFNNLLNPPEFEDQEAFQSEYLLMHDMQHIRNHFSVMRRVGADIAGNEMLKSMLGSMISSFAFEGDMTWDRMPKSRMPFQALLPRAAFEKWMYGHLLKICLPYPRPLCSSAPVYAPLNLSTLIRLMVSMFEAGYPAHWLSNMFSQICSGVLTTTARPPTHRVTDSAAVDAIHPPKEMSVRPWADEFSTLLSIWCGLLPFGIESL